MFVNNRRWGLPFSYMYTGTGLRMPAAHDECGPSLWVFHFPYVPLVAPPSLCNHQATIKRATLGLIFGVEPTYAFPQASPHN